ncbi:hypothetical protein DH2020_040699 [Rehmannia glutinosa]|uniref:Uncharacterized protein n=1 Tax=Rehmannia glutinosa TaxID=99300 RepID=A0ABR0US78_REHGL
MTTDRRCRYDEAKNKLKINYGAFTAILCGLRPELSDVINVLGEVTYAQAVDRAQTMSVNMNLDWNLHKAIQISVIIFNDDVNYFAGKFAVNNTYMIANTDVKKVNPLFPNAHPEKELVLKKYSIVNDAPEPIADKLDYNFVDFNDINLELHKNGVDEFRGCSQTPFCKRDRYQKPGSCPLIAIDVSITEGDIVAKLIPNENNQENSENQEKPIKPLVLTILTYQDGVMRLKIDEDQNIGTR